MTLKLTCLFIAQAHKFLTGYAPIRSLVRVGTAAGALLAIPAEQLRRDGGSAPRPNGAPPLSRKLQRSLTGADSNSLPLTSNTAPSNA